MALLILGLLLGIAYLLYVAVTARVWGDADQSASPKVPLLPVRRVR